MEDSEKRRERLKGMRAIAAQTETSYDVETSAASGLLVNPLLETSATLPGQEELGETPRFDFYTDPAAAFSANRKRRVTSNQVRQGSFTPPSNNSSMPWFSSPHPGQKNPEYAPSPAHQMQNNYPPVHQMQSNYRPNQGTYRGQAPHQNSISYRSPGGFHTPFPFYQGTPPASWNGSGGNGYCSPSPPHRGMSCPYPIRQGSPGFQSPSSNYERGKSHWPGNASGYGESPASSGRGRMHRHNNAGFRQSGGRGFHTHGSGADGNLGPEYYYDNSMFEDPWQHLEPVLWNGLHDQGNNSNRHGSSNSWLPKSISMKKPKVSEPSNKSTSGKSLAEYLAATFNEVTNDASSI